MILGTKRMMCVCGHSYDAHSDDVCYADTGSERGHNCDCTKFRQVAEQLKQPPLQAGELLPLLKQLVEAVNELSTEKSSLREDTDLTYEIAAVCRNELAKLERGE